MLIRQTPRFQQEVKDNLESDEEKSVELRVSRNPQLRIKSFKKINKSDNIVSHQSKISNLSSSSEHLTESDCDSIPEIGVSHMKNHEDDLRVERHQSFFYDTNTLQVPLIQK